VLGGTSRYVDTVLALLIIAGLPMGVWNPGPRHGLGKMSEVRNGICLYRTGDE